MAKIYNCICHACKSCNKKSNLIFIFSQTLKWRDDHKIESFIHWRPMCKTVEEDFVFKYQGRDNEGRPGSFIDFDLTFKQDTQI